MSMPNNNPFVLPGMGQHSDLSGNPLMASMEMMRQAWAGLTGPGGLAQSLPMTPPMNLEDLERRISELRSVEGWLRMNLSMLSSTIQGMEVQRSTIATLRSFADSLSSTDRTNGDTPASPLEVVLGLRPAPKPQAKPAAASAPSQSSGTAHTRAGSRTPPRGGAASTGFPGFAGFGQPAATVGAGTGAPGGDAGNRSDQAWSQAAGDAAAQASQAAAQAGQAANQAAGDATAQTSNAAQAWWDMLQQQFTNIAAATAASMPQTAGAADGRASAAKSAGAKSSGTSSGSKAPGSSKAGNTTASGSAAVAAPPAAARGTAKASGKTAAAKPAAAKKGAAKSASAKRAPAARKATARKSASNKTS